MPTAKIDANDIKTWIAYNETTGLVEPVHVDPVTGALLVHVSGSMSPSGSTVVNAKRDANDHPTTLGYNETTGMTDCLRTDTSGNLVIIQA